MLKIKPVVRTVPWTSSFWPGLKEPIPTFPSIIIPPLGAVVVKYDEYAIVPIPTLPTMANWLTGVIVPIPILPVELILIRSVKPEEFVVDVLKMIEVGKVPEETAPSTWPKIDAPISTLLGVVPVSACPAKPIPGYYLKSPADAPNRANHRIHPEMRP